jgi:dihydroorotate dehydrogenase
MLQTPFYDPAKSYEQNYSQGPFGAFTDNKIYNQIGEPRYDFLGQKIHFPFGIPAGTILNSNFAKAAFQKGFDILVYKTVRSGYYPCHPYPNILAIHSTSPLTLQKLQNPVTADTNYAEPISITNSFGVPSQNPETWQEDAKRAMTHAGKGQILILSFMGTVKNSQTQKELIDDYILAAKLAKETGVKILETNLSCPNIGNEGLVCYNLEITEKITKGIRSVIGNTPLILKVGYYEDDDQLEKLAPIANEYANSIAAINTLQATIVDPKGNQALPGKNRVRSGICGSAIKWAGIETIKRLKKIKEKKGYKFSIQGIGGVIKPEDYFEYKTAGADSVMSATGSMWNPYLAQEIKKDL